MYLRILPDHQNQVIKKSFFSPQEWLKTCFDAFTDHQNQVLQKLFFNDNLSRCLQPGYNYVGQTNDRQPLHISAVGRFRDYLPNSWLLSWPGQACAYPPPTLIPAVGCRSRILKHYIVIKMDTKKETTSGGIFSKTGQFYIVIIIVYCVFIYDCRKKTFSWSYMCTADPTGLPSPQRQADRLAIHSFNW